MANIQFRPCHHADIVKVQEFVDELFNLYPPDGARPNITRTYEEFARFP